MKLKNLTKQLLTCLLILFVSSFGYSQVTVTGTLTDGLDKQPLIGANILVKGTTTGAVTEFDGTYEITVPDENAVLVFSYTGYADQEVTVGAQRVIDLVMDAGTNLDEVVVVGYTTKKRGELTGSVSSIQNEDIRRTGNRDVAKSLAGKVPGLIVNDRGGYPGSQGDVSILIRGKSTLNNNSPLILIDGIPTANFNHLSPDDIESLSVLKDGAAAIYGARAANGVILITTRRGKAGKPQINFNSSYSLASFSTKPRQMSSEQYAIYDNEFNERLGNPLRFTPADISAFASGSGTNTNWFDLTFADTAPELRSTVSVSGGSDAVKYFVSGDYLDQEGIFASGDLNFEQYQLRSNLDMKVSNSFSIGLDLAGRYGTQNEPGVDPGQIYKAIYTNEPTELARNSDGSFARGGEDGTNPLIMTSSQSGYNRTNRNNLTGRFSYKWGLDFITPGLRVQGFAGYRKINTDTKSWYTPWTYFTPDQNGQLTARSGNSQRGVENILRETYFEFDELMLNTTVHFDKTFGDHSLRSFIGYEQFSNEQRNFFAERRGFPSDNSDNLFAGSDDGQISGGVSSEAGRLNYFGSVSYDFKKKYFVDLTLRHDGSSVFGPGNRYGTFPGAAVAWAIDQESFMSDTKWLNALKLRASWAQMGNDRIAPFQFLTRYNFGSNNPNVAQPNYYTFGVNGSRVNGYNPANTPNPDITWEKADMRNLGINFAILDYKLTGDLNYFYQKRTDILVQRNASIPDVAGLDLPQENLGEVDNFGWEAQLNWADKAGAINYNIGFNLTKAKNEVVFLDEAANVPDQLKREGFPIDSYIIYPTNGVFRDQAAVEAATVKLGGTVEGEPAYIDTNGDGAITAADRARVFSSPTPEIQYGITGGLSFKQFDFSFLFQGQANAEMFVFFDQGGAKPEYVFTERWTPDNRDARYTRAFTQGDAISGILGGESTTEAADFYLHDASFLRLKEIELGYTFDGSKTKFGDVRIFARGFNLLTMFSDVYDLGLDPEAASYNNFRNSTYPSLKSYSFGINVKFK